MSQSLQKNKKKQDKTNRSTALRGFTGTAVKSYFRLVLKCLQSSFIAFVFFNLQISIPQSTFEDDVLIHTYLAGIKPKGTHHIVK